ncbi:MAG: hypothetical protein HFE90_09985 [Firmicutes bacterium]|nr:hypothetical protein [Bacillota bacterium]
MTELIKEIFMQNVVSSVKAAAVIALLFILTKPISKRYTAGFRYYSWLAVMIVFLIPFGSMGISYEVDLTPAVTVIRNEVTDIREERGETPAQTAAGQSSRVDRAEYEYTDDSGAEVQPQAADNLHKNLKISEILAFIWLSGVFVYFIQHIKRYILYKRTVRRFSEKIEDEGIKNILEEEKSRLNISKKLSIRVLGFIDTPTLAGILKPEIVLPHTDYTEDELRLILRHELIHFKRKDICYQFVILIFVSLHWFNPMAHIMARAVEIDGETSCDEKTLRGKEYEEKLFYGEMLLKFLKTETQKKSYMTTTFFGGKQGMKKRLIQITNKKSLKKGTVMMITVILVAVMASVSVMAMSSEYFEYVFKDDVSYLNDFIKTDKKSVSDERFTMTLEQYLVAENEAVLIVSFEAHTQDAAAELNDRDAFWNMDTISFYPSDSSDYDKAYCGSFSTGSLANGKFDTENKKYFKCKSSDIINDERIDFYITTDRIKGENKTAVPMDYNLKTRTVEFDDITVRYNPISISLKYPVSVAEDDCDFCSWDGTYFYFRMKDGEIKPFNQLYVKSGGTPIYDDEDSADPDLLGWESKAWAKSVMKPGDIKSIIVNDVEYPVDYPSKAKPVKVDEKIKPFVIGIYLYEGADGKEMGIPLREFCDGLGAELSWDNKTKSAIVEYKGSEYVFTVGSSTFMADGKECSFYGKAPFIDEKGRMILPDSLSGYNDNEYMADYHWFDRHDENGEISPNGKYHVFPL